jgi:hypothetical protein
MDDQQLLSALSGQPQEAGSEASDLITDAADVEEILESGASLHLGQSPDEDGVIGETDGIPAMGRDDDLEAVRQQRDQAMSILQQQQMQAQQAQAYEYWEGSRQRAEAAFAAQERQIYQDAQQAYDATEYIKDKMSSLNAQRDAWRTQYYAAREQTLRQAAERMAVPNYAAEIANQYNLTEQDVSELMQFPPQMMAQVAGIMANRQSQQQRSRTARSVSKNMVAPGNGRSAGRIKAGSDAHLYALLKGVSE